MILVMQNSSRLSGLKAHATPLEQQKALICGYLSTSLPKSLNMSCSKSSVPKLYLDLQPYSQNTVHKLFSQVVTVASAAILIPLCHKCNKSYSAYFGKNMTCHTQEIYFSNTQGNYYFCTGATLSRIEGGIRLRFWETGPRHIITATIYHSDILSQRQIVTLRINGMLNSWKQAFPV